MKRQTKFKIGDRVKVTEHYGGDMIPGAVGSITTVKTDSIGQYGELVLDGGSYSFTWREHVVERLEPATISREVLYD